MFVLVHNVFIKALVVKYKSKLFDFLPSFCFSESYHLDPHAPNLNLDLKFDINVVRYNL